MALIGPLEGVWGHQGRSAAADKPPAAAESRTPPFPPLPPPLKQLRQLGERESSMSSIRATSSRMGRLFEGSRSSSSPAAAPPHQRLPPPPAPPTGDPAAPSPSSGVFSRLRVGTEGLLWFIKRSGGMFTPNVSYMHELQAWPCMHDQLHSCMHGCCQGTPLFLDQAENQKPEQQCHANDRPNDDACNGSC